MVQKYVLIIFLGMASVLFAQNENRELVTDRPDFTESAVTVPMGMWQIESGYTFTRIGGVKMFTAGEILVRKSIFKNIELRIGLNSLVFQKAGDLENETGLEDIELGFKVHLVDTDGKLIPNLALLVSTSVPTGANQFSSEKSEPGVNLAMGWGLSETVDFGTNISYSYLAGADDPYGELGLSVAMGVGLTDKLSAFVEYFSFFPTNEAIDKTGYFDSGLTLGLSENIQADWRWGIGVNKYNPDYFSGLGLVVRF